MYIWGETWGGSSTAATSKMELFLMIVNGFQPLTVITKCSILDVAAVLDPHQETCIAMQWLLFILPENSSKKKRFLYSNVVINKINTKKICLSYKFINKKCHDVIYSDRRWKSFLPLANKHDFSLVALELFSNLIIC